MITKVESIESGQLTPYASRYECCIRYRWSYDAVWKTGEIEWHTNRRTELKEVTPRSPDAIRSSQLPRCLVMMFHMVQLYELGPLLFMIYTREMNNIEYAHTAWIRSAMQTTVEFIFIAIHARKTIWSCSFLNASTVFPARCHLTG